ncbi:WG repeat-containing protein [Anoxynatronum sibiricum]|uniref:WG repeat-containing protein n=1 Tax=Anoxynatronum sibiricum TaxID=210623 RepID=A0ABU9VTN9_9CLOT
MKRINKNIYATLVFCLAAFLMSCGNSPELVSQEDVSKATPEMAPESIYGYSLLPVSVDSQWGFMNTSGEIVIEPVFQQVHAFSDNGLAPVQVDNLWGLINNKGEFVVEPQFDYMHHQFSMGLIGAGIVEPGEFGFLNKDGDWAIAPTDILAGHFNEEGLAVFSINEQYGVMDINRNILIEPMYDFIFDAALLDWEQVPFLLNDQWGSMNRQGEVVIEATFDSLFHFDKAGMARIESHEGCTFVDLQGEVLFSVEADQCDDFVGDYARVTKDGKWGYINRTGKQTIDFEYDDVSVGGFDHDLAAVMKDGLWGFINPKGEWVIEPAYDLTNGIVSDGLIAVQENERWGFIDLQGTYVIQPNLLNHGPFINGIAWIVNEEGKVGYMDSQGNIVIEPRFDRIMSSSALPKGYSFSDDGFALVKEENSLGIIDLQGKYVLPPTIERILLDGVEVLQ